MIRKYYEAYDERYRQVHGKDLRWFGNQPSAIVAQVMQRFCIRPALHILELGCGEGRDAFALLEQGFDLLATDISEEAIMFCRKEHPEYAERFQTLDCVAGTLDGRFDFIYAIAVVHMLVVDADREAFYAFIREHLQKGGIALIGTIGEGLSEWHTDVRTAFEPQERVHGQTGQHLRIAGTSCRVVSFPTFRNELERSGLTILQEGITSVKPDFPQMMYAVAQAK